LQRSVPSQSPGRNF